MMKRKIKQRVKRYMEVRSLRIIAESMDKKYGIESNESIVSWIEYFNLKFSK